MKNILLVTALAVLWGIGGALVGQGISALFDVSWVIPCTSFNVIAGMIMLLLVTSNDTARRIFYEGPRDDDPGIIGIGLLWLLPMVAVFIGLIWWLLAQFLN